MAAEQDFSMFTGDSKTLVIEVLDEDDAVVDITGWTFKWRLSRSVRSAALVSKTSASGITITNSPAGLLEVEIDPADTDALRAGLYYHEVEGIDQDSEISTVIAGAATLKPTLIRSV